MKRKEVENKMKEAISQAEDGKLESALIIFNQLMEAVPHEPEIFYNAGLCFSQAGEHLEALKALQKASDLRPSEDQFLQRLALEEYQVGGGEIFATDFMSYDPLFLRSCVEHCEQLLARNPGLNEAQELKSRAELKIGQNRMAFKFCDGDLEYCRKTISRKRELTNLDERVMGFLNLLDSGEYLYQKGRFGVVRREDLVDDASGGFLNRIRNYVLGK